MTSAEGQNYLTTGDADLTIRKFGNSPPLPGEMHRRSPRDAQSLFFLRILFLTGRNPRWCRISCSFSFADHHPPWPDATRWLPSTGDANPIRCLSASVSFPFSPLRYSTNRKFLLNKATTTATAKVAPPIIDRSR